MNRFRNKTMKETLTKDAEGRIQEGIFTAFAYNNIDTDLHRTTLSHGERSQTFYETISIARQVQSIPPVQTNQTYSPTTNDILNASSLAGANVSDVSSAKALLLGTVVAFSENLPTENEANATSSDHLLRQSLKEKCSGSSLWIEHLEFLELPSKSAATVRTVLDQYLQVATPRTGLQSPDYILAVFDMPLFLTEWEATYESVPAGERNCEPDAIVLVPGGMHFYNMCLTDVVKRLCYNAFMDGFVRLSGLN